MATKKQKREAALAKRERFLAAERELGLKAIEAAKHQREAEARKAWEKRHEKHFVFNDECPHCIEIKKKQENSSRKASIEKVAQASKFMDDAYSTDPSSTKAGA